MLRTPVARAMVEALRAFHDPRDRGRCDHCGGPRLDDNFLCGDCGGASGLFGQMIAERAARHTESPALAALDRVGPYTIVWLNEAQFYLAVAMDARRLGHPLAPPRALLQHTPVNCARARGPLTPIRSRPGDPVPTPGHSSHCRNRSSADRLAQLKVRRHDRLGGLLHEYEHAA